MQSHSHTIFFSHTSFFAPTVILPIPIVCCVCWFATEHSIVMVARNPWRTFYPTIWFTQSMAALFNAKKVRLAYTIWWALSSIFFIICRLNALPLLLLLSSSFSSHSSYSTRTAIINGSLFTYIIRGILYCYGSFVLYESSNHIHYIRMHVLGWFIPFCTTIFLSLFFFSIIFTHINCERWKKAEHSKVN